MRTASRASFAFCTYSTMECDLRRLWGPKVERLRQIREHVEPVTTLLSLISSKSDCVRLFSTCHDH